MYLAIQVPGEREGGLALHLVAEDRDSREVVAEWHLVEGEQRTGGDGEVLAARLAAPAQTPGRPTRRIDRLTTAVRADRLALGGSPADADEGVLDFLVRHAEDGADGERPGLR